MGEFLNKDNRENERERTGIGKNGLGQDDGEDDEGPHRVFREIEETNWLGENVRRFSWRALKNLVECWMLDRVPWYLYPNAHSAIPTKHSVSIVGIHGVKVTISSLGWTWRRRMYPTGSVGHHAVCCGTVGWSSKKLDWFSRPHFYTHFCKGFKHRIRGDKHV